MKESTEASSTFMNWQGSAALFLFTGIVHVLLIIFVVIRFLLERNEAQQPVHFGDALSAAQTASQVFEETMHKDYEDRNEG